MITIVPTVNGCAGPASNYTIKVNKLPIINLTLSAPNVCSTSEVIISASGAQSYVWSPLTNLTFIDGATAKANPPTTTTYTVTGTDGNGCTASKTITITPQAPFAVSSSQTNLLCNGASTGSIDLQLRGGSLPYVVTWSNGATTEDLTNLIAGTYTYTARDNNGCVISNSIIITQPLAPLTLTESHTNVLCNGGTTSLSLTAGGGTGLYQYSRNNIFYQNTNIFSVLLAGSYTFYVKDGNNCIQTVSATITEPLAMTLSPSSKINATCNGTSTGTVTAGTVANSVGSLTYSWKNSLNVVVGTAASVTNLPAGNYTLTVKDNCGILTNSVTITEPAVMTLSPSSKKNVTCNGTSTGTVTAGTVTNSVGTLTYSWKNSSNVVVGTTANMTNLPTGNYTLTVTDNCGFLTNSVTITEPSPLNATLNINNTTCKFSKDGSILPLVTGGTSPYQYFWDGKATSGNGLINSLAAGQYKLKVIDANNCSLDIIANVLPGNCAPNAANDNHQTLEDTPITINTPGVIINDSDPDGDEIKIMLNTVRDPNAPIGSVIGNICSFFTVNGGVVMNNNGSFTYTPRKNFNGTERFVYKVSDGSLLSNFATVTVVVLAVNDPPIAIDDNYSTPEDTPIDGTVIPNDSDPDGDILTYKLLAQPNNAVVSFNADGTFRFVPVLNFNGTIVFDYQVCDPLGLCDTAKVTVIVTPVNDPPVALDDAFKTQTNLPFNNQVIDNDTDPDNDQLQYAAITQPANGSLTFNTNGTFIYTPRNGFKGTDTFTYRACDPAGLCDNATVTILVQPIVTVNLTPSTATIKEGEKISITAVLTEFIFEDAIITLGFGGTATNNSDYTLTGSFVTITIKAGQTTSTQEFTINSINDALRDDGEQVIANVTDTSSPFVLIGTGSFVNITDIYPLSIPLKPEENPDINPDPLTSPNGDGQGNEKFVIYNISKYPNNEVVIFNRWGNEVYRVKDYNNEDVSFKGVANVGLLTNSNKDLVDGVYYYVIQTNYNGEKKLNRGYLILKR